MNNAMDTQRAAEDLQLIKATMVRAKEALSIGGAYYLILWGIIYLLGYSGSQFLGDVVSGKLWIILVSCGIIGSFLIGRKLGSKTVSRTGIKIMLFWIFLLIYTPLWIWIMKPAGWTKISLFIATVAMFGYIVMGLWTDTRLVITGLAVTILALIIYFLFPTYIGILMALLAGGTMIGSGIYMIKKWKANH